MQLSKEILEKAGVVPKLRLAMKNEKGIPTGTGPHRVKILEEKLVKGRDDQGQEVHIVRYTFEEGGEKKRYDVPVKDKKGEVHYLIQQFSEIEPEEEIQLTFKKANGRSYIEVLRFKQASHVEVGDEEEAVIQLDEEDK